MWVKKLNILGLTIFSLSALALIGFGLHEFLKQTDMPIIIKWGIAGVLLGIIVILISLVVERIKDYKIEK